MYMYSTRKLYQPSFLYFISYHADLFILKKSVWDFVYDLFELEIL